MMKNRRMYIKTLETKTENPELVAEKSKLVHLSHKAPLLNMSRLWVGVGGHGDEK